VTAGGSATLSVNAGTASAGTYTLTVTGTEGAATHSTTVSLTVTTAAGLPGAPTLTATRSSRRGVQLSWTVPASNGSPISAYRIYRGLTSGSEVFLIQRGSGSTSYRDTSTSSGSRYYYQITAVNGVGEGPRSTEATAVAR
jgi:fibronectin type 3 domain-containing protein